VTKRTNDRAMPDRPHVCVFCGSSLGARPSYVDAARRVGAALARRGIGLVYGGGQVGLMGVVADAALAEGGRVVGVIPDPLATKEVAHAGLTELHVVPGMHERKALMSRLSDGFLTLPGGIGTYEEFFEILTWFALGLHPKPLGLLDVDGYFGPLRALLAHGVDEKFIHPRHVDVLVLSDHPESLVDAIVPRLSP
jgi:uncharacterized protein (TIGR00730 family)